MSIDVQYRVVDQFEEPEFADLTELVFDNYAPSVDLAAVLDAETVQSRVPAGSESDTALRIGAYSNDRLVGWSFGRPLPANRFHMVNSGVAPAMRGNGIYTQLVQQMIELVTDRNYIAIDSRHEAANVAVIIPKLKSGFLVSGFEYSEVYGPLVRLTYIVSQPRKELYESRAHALRPA